MDSLSSTSQLVGTVPVDTQSPRLEPQQSSSISDSAEDGLGFTVQKNIFPVFLKYLIETFAFPMNRLFDRGKSGGSLGGD